MKSHLLKVQKVNKGELTTTKITAEEDIPYHPSFLPADMRSGRMQLVHKLC
jgi:hypothetical protein